MNYLKRCVMVLLVATVSFNAWAAELETEAQKLSYIMGMDIGNMLRDQAAGVDLDLDLDTLVEALRATVNGEETQMTSEEADVIRQAFIQKLQAEREAEVNAVAQTNLAEGQEFLAGNKEKEGVQVTESGLQYEVLTMGDGAKPVATDTVKVHYRGSLLDGTEFDSSFERNMPATFPLNGVISGWTEGVQLMPVGSKFRFYIAPELGYGEAGGGPIPPNATLIFEIELLEIEVQQ